MMKQDISNMLSRLIDLPTDQGFAPGSKMFVFQEVIDQGGEPIKVNEYYDTGKIQKLPKWGEFKLNYLRIIGYVTEFRYCSQIAAGIQSYSKLSSIPDYGWGMAQSDRAFIFVDNHDNQRGHGGAGI